MKMCGNLKALLLVVALLTGASALAQEAKTSFAALDRDKDGMISVTEARADKKISAQFAQADKDQDGFLSRAEFDAIVSR
jgi:Ca2+-binding EF-hand superfamily protein